ncbi:LuxR family transcriptional regulator [Herbiconiux moechotypicola]|uniref:LuxR family transcriptional regulator n=2 Tax=Herbiconiux moechotypicola TaxID=637393 RepID=A0ABP5QHU3_9MICO
MIAEAVDAADAALRPRLWVGDTIERLDGDAAERLAEAVGRGRLVPLMTATQGARLAPPVHELLRSGRVTRVEPTPFSPAQTLRIVEGELGCTLGAGVAADFVPQRPGGDLTLLLSALDIGLRQGSIRRDGGVVVEGPRGYDLDELRPLLEERHRIPVDDDDPAAVAAHLIGLVPDLDLLAAEALLADVTGQADRAFERLEDSGVVDVLDSPPSGFRLRLHDPVVELLLPHTMGRLRRRRLSAGLLDSLTARPADQLGEGEVVALVRESVALGRPLPADAATRAAILTLHAGQAELAVHLAEIAVEAGGGLSSQLTLSAARARFSEAHAESTSNWSLPRHQATLARDLVASMTINRLRIGNPAETTVAASTESTGWMVESDRLAQEASRAVLVGDPELARTRLAEAEAALAPSGADRFRVRWGRAQLDLFDGVSESLLAELRGLRDEARSRGIGSHQAMASMLLGFALQFAGRSAEALGPLREAELLASSLGMDGIVHRARTDLAAALAATGDSHAAWEILRPVLDVADGELFVHGQALASKGRVLAAEGRQSEAAAAAVSAAAAHESQGLALFTLFALVDAARLGLAGSVCARVERLTRDVADLTRTSLARHVRALAALERLGARPGEHEGPGGEYGDDRRSLASEFSAIGALEAAVGFPLLSAESFAHAGVLHESCGQDREAAAARRSSERQAQQCGVIAPASATSPRASGLSEREREIASLAVEGLSNREIGERLVISVRTVETHLLRAYRKLGVRERSELAAALS